MNASRASKEVSRRTSAIHVLNINEIQIISQFINQNNQTQYPSRLLSLWGNDGGDKLAKRRVLIEREINRIAHPCSLRAWREQIGCETHLGTKKETYDGVVLGPCVLVKLNMIHTRSNSASCGQMPRFGTSMSKLNASAQPTMDCEAIICCNFSRCSVLPKCRLPVFDGSFSSGICDKLISDNATTISICVPTCLWTSWRNGIAEGGGFYYTNAFEQTEKCWSLCHWVGVFKIGRYLG